MSFAENLRYMRRKANCSQNQLAADLGYKSFTTIQKWEDGSAVPPYKTITRIAEYFGVTVEEMMDGKVLQLPNLEIPVLGVVSGGEPILAEQNYLGFEHVIPDDARRGECFYLQVVGDSMKDARILPGDLIYVKKQEYLNNGDIGVVMIDNEATVKKVIFTKDGMTLQPANDEYSPIVLTKKDIEERQVRIIGKVLHNRINFS